MAYNIFLSHTAADAELVNDVRRAAEALEMEVYIYEEDLQAGANLPAKLIGAIRECDAVVALLTKAGTQRPAISLEVGCALQADKPVIAVVEDGVDFKGYTLLQGREYIALDRAKPTNTLLAIQEALRAHRSRQTSTAIAWGAALVLIFLALGGSGKK